MALTNGASLANRKWFIGYRQMVRLTATVELATFLAVVLPSSEGGISIP